MDLPANLPESLRPAFERFAKHLGELDEMTQIVLKGHLVLEVGLDEILKHFVFNPTLLDRSNLRFYQKIQLARAFSLDESDNNVWDLIEAINSLRNQLAHSLDEDRRRPKVERVKDLYFGMYEAVSDEETQLPDYLIVSFAVALCNGFLGSFHAEAERFRTMVDTLDFVVNPHRHKARCSEHTKAARPS